MVLNRNRLALLCETSVQSPSEQLESFGGLTTVSCCDWNGGLGGRADNRYPCLLRLMDTVKLGVFKVVADELHFGRAAQRLHIAQPAVSRTIAQLETSLGVKLFDRSTRSVNLTPAGLQLQASAGKILNAVEVAEKSVRAAVSGDAGIVEISFAGATTSAYMAELSRSLRAKYPAIEIDLLSHYLTQTTIENLQNGSQDLAIGRWDTFPSNLSSYVIKTESLVVATPTDHWLADHGEVSFAELRDEPFVGLEQATTSILLSRLQELSYAAGFEPKVVQTAQNTEILLALVSAGVGLTLTLSSVRERGVDPHVSFVPVVGEYTPVHLRLLWNPKNTNPTLPKVLEVAQSALPAER